MDKEMTLVGHLEELRKGIIISLTTIVALSILAFPFSPKLLEILKSPGRGVMERLVFFDPPEAFLVHIKLSFLTGLVASMPVIMGVYISRYGRENEEIRAYFRNFICGGIYMRRPFRIFFIAAGSP